MIMTAKDGHLATVLIDGRWQELPSEGTFETTNPATGEGLGRYPVSPWSVIDQALQAGAQAYREVVALEVDHLNTFLRAFADGIEARAAEIVDLAHQETALPIEPRLKDVELPRTTNQLRQAADAVGDRSWRNPILSPSARIASYRAPLPGIVAVFGPNNFPLAFNGIGGGDFAAAVATGHPVIGKANPGHPGTTRLLAEIARAAVDVAGLPPAFVQLVYRTSHADGEAMVSDERIAATGYTGSRAGGLALKRAADAAGKPIYLEMSSVNPVVVLPGALSERADDIADDLCASMLAGAGQFCTSPGIVLALDGPETDELRIGLTRRLESVPSGTLLGVDVERGLGSAVAEWEAAGAHIVAAGEQAGPGCSYPNTMMEVDGSTFLDHRSELQREAFGNVSLLVVASSAKQLVEIVSEIEGNLTGSIYSAHSGADEDAYREIAPVLREKVGRLLNDKAPTGVAVVAAMNHGGPYPSTGHPGFTAVGIPTSLARFSMLQCFDGVRDHRLPPELQAANPLGLERLVDGEWTRAPITWGD